jgi:hypothetical protein
MPWKSLSPAILEPVKKALQARRAHPALSRGGRVPLLAERDQLVMAKVTPEETVLVGVNLANEPKEVTVDVSNKVLVPGSALQPVLGESAAAFVPETGQIRWKLPAMSTVMVAGKTRP